MNPSKQKIIIVGAGLCGSLLAIVLAKKGFNVAVYEKRPDLRQTFIDAGRSINLALSKRGLLALSLVGLEQQVLDICIPMKGRLIHPLGGETFLSRYSGREEDYINSVSRPGLNMFLLDTADDFSNVTLHFDSKVTDVDLKTATISYLKDGSTQQDQGDVVIGTDGAGSIIRRTMMQNTTKLLFNYEQNFLRYGYKELSIPAGSDGGWQIEKEALHIWPRGSYMVIALPNLDGSFTLTMFHPYSGDVGFDSLDSDQKVRAMFEKHYPTLLPYLPHLEQEYKENPVGTLGTIKCYPWNAFGKCLIMGDASHAIVPFYGQGMNASLEDVRIFDSLFDTYGDDWNQLFSAFQEIRVENTNAIADLAIDNFYEMRDHVDDQNFMRKRKIEMQLEQTFEDYYSKYSLVTFKPHLSYAEAMKLGRAQDALLLQMCDRSDYDQVPLQEYYQATKALQNQ